MIGKLFWQRGLPLGYVVRGVISGPETAQWIVTRWADWESMWGVNNQKGYQLDCQEETERTFCSVRLHNKHVVKDSFAYLSHSCLCRNIKKGVIFIHSSCFFVWMLVRLTSFSPTNMPSCFPKKTTTHIWFVNYSPHKYKFIFRT